MIDDRANVTITENILSEASPNTNNKKGLEEPFATKTTLKVLPNPSTHQFRLIIEGMSSTQPARIKITDAIGRVVALQQQVIPAGGFIFGSNYLPGVYVIEVIQGNQRQTFKVIKSRTY
jgi:hypothetical protein